MATKAKRTKKTSPEQVETKPVGLDLSAFLPGKGADLDEYLKDVPEPGTKKPKGKKAAAAAEPEVPSGPMMSVHPMELAAMMEKSMKLANAQHDNENELPASAASLGIDQDFVTSEKGGGTYDYSTGRYYHPKSLSSDLSHFTEFHRLHNLVSDALEKHSALQNITNETTEEGRTRRVGPFDGVDTHLLRASRAITDSMQKHMEGKALTEEKQQGVNAVSTPGSMVGFVNAITHLKNASKELSRRTNGDFKDIKELANNLHQSYIHHVEGAGSHIALASDEQRELELRNRAGRAPDEPAKPEPMRLPLERPGYADVRRRIRRDKAQEIQEIAAGRRPQTAQPVVGKPREMFMAKPANVKSEMDWSAQENEVSPEEGKAQSIARTQTSMAESAARLEGANNAARELRRRQVRRALNNPEVQRQNSLQRADLSYRVEKLNTPFPQPESRIAAFRAQQEGTSLTTGKEQKGTGLRTTEAFQSRLASEDAKNKQIVQDHIDRGEIAEAAAHHYRTLEPTRTIKQQESLIKKIKNNPHRYLAENGFAAGEPPRKEQERVDVPGRAPARIRTKAKPAVGAGGQIVSRAKINRQNQKESFGQGTSASSPYRPEASAEYEAKLAESDQATREADASGRSQRIRKMGL